jgi:hypothetical protein
MGILQKMAFRIRIIWLFFNAIATGTEVEKTFLKDLYCFVLSKEIKDIKKRLRPKKESITMIPPVYEKALRGTFGRERIQLLKHYVWVIERLKREEKTKYADKYGLAVRALADILPTNGSGGECLLKAEMFRRLGKYQEAIDILDKYDFSDNAEWKVMSMAIKEHAKKSDPDLFVLTVDEQMKIAKQLGCYDDLSLFLGIEDKFRITS